MGSLNQGMYVADPSGLHTGSVTALHLAGPPPVTTPGQQAKNHSGLVGAGKPDNRSVLQGILA